MSTINLTSDTFEAEVLNSNVPVLVDFWAPWCGPCKAMAPDLDAVADELAGTVKITKINVDEYADIATRYHVQAMPTLLLFKDGQLVDLRAGAQRKSTMLSWLKSAA